MRLGVEYPMEVDAFTVAGIQTRSRFNAKTFDDLLRASMPRPLTIFLEPQFPTLLLSILNLLLQSSDIQLHLPVCLCLPLLAVLIP